MATQGTRRSFLRASYLKTETMRPPGALGMEPFGRACDGCGDCARACPEQIIRKDSEGLAALDLSRGACTFCHACIEACPTGALLADRKDDWNWIARVGTACLSLQAISCRTCEDFCDEQAIRFRLELGGKARPMIDEDLCTGCGACAGGCPAGAIEFARQEITTLEATG